MWATHFDRYYLERQSNNGQRRKSSPSQTQQTSAGANSATQGRDQEILRPHNHEPHRCPQPEVSRRNFRLFCIRQIWCQDQFVGEVTVSLPQNSETKRTRNRPLVTQPRLAFLGMLAGYLFPGSTAGFVILPTNKSAPLRLSRIMNTNGWSARNIGGIDTTDIPTPVAAAASVPSSFTSTKAL